LEGGSYLLTELHRRLGSLKIYCTAGHTQMSLILLTPSTTCSHVTYRYIATGLVCLEFTDIFQ